MNLPSEHLLIIIIPLIVSNVIHMIIVKKDGLSFLKIPIWEKGFGKNKTWRGFLIVSLINALILPLVNNIFAINFEWPVLLGFLLGTAYIIFELPNSYLKRRIGIAPGEKHPKKKVLFMVLDKTDSPFGVMLIYYSLGLLSLGYSALLVAAGAVVHALISQLLVITNVKKSF